jgi:peptidoglycan/xylan/chitin deacetylase (PgdA/CDA1 family)
VPDSISFIALRSIALAGVLCAAGCATSNSGARSDGSVSGAGGGAGGATGGATGGGGAPGNAGGATGKSGLPVPPAAGVPQPSGAAGNLTVLDWAGFKAAVSYTFDDANSSQIQRYPDLQALGVPMTFFLITGKTEASDPIWATAIADGHEVSNHTMSHAQVGTGADIDAATAFLQQHLGVTAYDMAAPYGDPSYPPLARPRFLLNRGVSDGLMGPNDGTDPYSLFCYVPPPGAGAAAFNVEIDGARAAGKWRTVLVHGFTGGTDGAYQPVSITEFTAGVAYAKSFGDVWIGTMIDVGAYWRAQKMLTSVTPAASGASTTWTWTLPDHFPPGRYLRVKVDGGTLTQGGAALTWDEHGYYEVALDAGSLTLSP